MIPSDSLYKIHFQSVTGLEFPENGEIIYCYSSSADGFGDRTHISVADIGTKNYNKVYGEIKKNGFEELVTPTNYSFVLSEIKPLKVNSEFILYTPGKFKKIAFLNDSSSVIINLIVW